jgi:uncharacterized membrane protein
LLDKAKYEDRKGFWQLINILAPVLLVVIFIALYQYLRKMKYGR